MLEIKDLNKSFGGLKAVNNVNLEVSKGSITGLIGPNGAGKTTLFNTIAGLYTPENGDIHLEKKNITGLKPLQNILLHFSHTTLPNNLFLISSFETFK